MLALFILLTCIDVINFFELGLVLPNCNQFSQQSIIQVLSVQHYIYQATVISSMDCLGRLNDLGDRNMLITYLDSSITDEV